MTRALQPVERIQPAFFSEGLGYAYSPPGLPLMLHAEYLHRRSDEFTAELIIERTDGRGPPILLAARCNLTSIVGRKSFVTQLEGIRDEAVGANWRRLIEEFAYAIVKSEREGQPFFRAGELPSSQRPPDLITRLLPGSAPTMWFAPQGTGKGWTAMIACAAVASGRPFAGLPTRQARPLYLDWEDSPDIWQSRLVAVAQGLELDDLPDVHYRQCRNRLATDLPSVLRYIQQHDIGVLVIDSVGPAMGAGEGQRWDDQAIEFFGVLRNLVPLPILLIDHVTGADVSQGPKEEDKAFGSVYKMAEVRTAWSIRKEQDTDASEQVLAFFHRKHNHTRKFPSIGMRLSFESDVEGWASRVWAQASDVRDSIELSKGLSQPEQILAFLRRHGPAMYGAIGEALSLKDNAVRSIVGRLERRNKVLRTSDGRVSLAAEVWPVK